MIEKKASLSFISKSRNHIKYHEIHCYLSLSQRRCHKASDIGSQKRLILHPRLIFPLLDRRSLFIRLGKP